MYVVHGAGSTSLIRINEEQDQTIKSHQQIAPSFEAKKFRISFSSQYSTSLENFLRADRIFFLARYIIICFPF